MPAEAAPSYLWVPELAGVPGVVELSRQESHYLARARAEVERFERCERRRRAWVWCGPPEGLRADWLVEKLAELGIETWQPLECERARWRRGAGALERWRRLAVAALRQSRRRFLMEVRPPASLAEVAGSISAGSLRSLADPGGRRGAAPPVGAGWAVGAVGPAAGFSSRERALLADLGFEAIALWDGRLRSETAALAWAAWWALGD